MNNGVRIAVSALSHRIFAGRVSKDGTSFLAGKVDATSDVLKAVIEFVGAGNVSVVEVDGAPAFEIEVRSLPAASGNDATAPSDEKREVGAALLSREVK